MTSPLSPAQDAVLNSVPSLTKRKYDDYDMMAFPSQSSSPLQNSPDRSRPVFRTSATANGSSDQENATPSKSRHGRVASGSNELSPLRMAVDSPSAGRAARGAARRMSPEKRFPVKISSSNTSSGSGASSDNVRSGRHERTTSLENAVAANEGLKRAIEMFEDEQEELERREGGGGAADESLMSTFSAFSAVPNMAMLAKLGTPKTRGTPSPLKSAAQTPSQQYGSLGNLLDFDIPPMPTPRSIPSITPRELESLRSKFLSEISSLKASLSGKEAEVQSLKSAVGDAEKRVGQSSEQLREERALKEQLAAEKESWEKRGREMESMLRKIKEEMLMSQGEREDLERQLEESEKRREATEMMHQEAETKLASLRAGKDHHHSHHHNNSKDHERQQQQQQQQQASPEKLRSSGPSSSNREVEMAVERVARELHALYKSKHETKVAALKKSYENRWEKKVRGLEARIEDLARENEKLRSSGPDPNATMARMDEEEAVERKAQAVRDKATIKELHANAQRLEAVVSSVKRDNEELRRMLQQERVEKGELVQLAEELMGMQQAAVATPAPSQRQPEMVAKTPRASVVNNRSSGLRAPGASGIRAPTTTAPSARSSVGGLPRPGGKPVDKVRRE